MIFLFTIFFKELDSTFGGTILISREAITKFDLMFFFFLGGFRIFGLVLCLNRYSMSSNFFYFYFYFFYINYIYCVIVCLCRDDAASRCGRENIITKGSSFKSAERADKICISRKISFKSVLASP